MFAEDRIDPESAHGKEPNEASVAQSRRTLLRRGFGAAVPVVVTLASAPVSAGTCMLASGFTSVATFKSRNPAGLNNCTGYPPSHWVSDTSVWPSGVDKGNLPSGTVAAALGNGTKFNGIFNPDLGTDKSLRLVLSSYQTTATIDTLAAAVVAMWLNAKNLPGGIYSESYVIELWANIAVDPYGYKPRAGSGKNWTLQETQNWIALSWGYGF